MDYELSEDDSHTVVNRIIRRRLSRAISISALNECGQKHFSQSSRFSLASPAVVIMADDFNCVTTQHERNDPGSGVTRV